MAEINLTQKQTRAFDMLTLPEYSHVSEILYGGAAGGGKSYLGCLWIITSALLYPKTRWLIGRAVYRTLRETTLNSFFDVVNKMNIAVKFIENKGIFFDNGSEVLLKDLAYKPSDPNYDELGSLEITGAFIDECPQIKLKAWQLVKSRIRYRLDEYKLTPKILGTCNPSKEWPYELFYLPDKEKCLDNHKAFIPALVTDNEYISEHYIDNLKTLDEISRSRLLYGDWDYSDREQLWAFSFYPEKHTGECGLNQEETVYLSFDFNRDPITCCVFQHYNDAIYCLELIDINDSTIYVLCDEISKRYPDCWFVVTGDASGAARSALSRMNYYEVIAASLGLRKSQIQISRFNPPLAESRMLVNAMLERYPIIIDKNKAKSLIFDLGNVKSDNEGKPVKKNRNDLTQRADALDTLRYFLHKFFKDQIKILGNC